MTSPSMLQTMLRPRCPRCGNGKLFARMLKVADHCSECTLPIGQHDAGDGPTFFAITLVGFLIMAGAGIVEYHFTPPMWVHAALWLPLTFILCILCLRVFKAVLILLEFRTGRFDGKSNA